MSRFRNCVLMLVALLLTLGVSIESHASILFGATGSGGGTSSLYTINTSTGAGTLIGSIGFNVSGISFDPTTGILYGLSGLRGAGPATLVTINTATGAGTLVGLVTGPVNDGFPDISFDSAGNLFAWTETNDSLVRINKATAAVTFVGPSIGSAITGLAFDNSGVLYREVGGALTTINPVTGALISTIGGVPRQVGMGMDFNESNTLFALERLGAGATGARNLVTVNTSNASVTTIGLTVPGLDALAFQRDTGGVVPEPATFVVWGGIGLLGAGVAVRQRKLQLA